MCEMAGLSQASRIISTAKINQDKSKDKLNLAVSFGRHKTRLTMSDIPAPELWKPAVFNYAVACDIFPRLTEVWNLPYLINCYNTNEFPDSEKTMFTPDLSLYQTFPRKILINDKF